MANAKEKPKHLIDLVQDESLKEVLRQPVGTPVKLTREQALAVVRAGMASTTCATRSASTA